MRVALWPDFSPKENGDGGIRRVWEALNRHLPSYGIELVNRFEDADVINVHADNIKSDKPIAYSNHGLYWVGYDWPAWALEANAKLIHAAKHAGALSVPSHFVHNVFARGMLHDPYVLHHGVDLEEWEPVSNGGFVLWAKNRVDPICTDKPVNKLAELCPDIPFVSTFGNPDLSNITLTGKMPYARSREVLKHAGVYLATVQETGGITVLECAAAGIPSVGFAWGVNPEIIVHGETGYLVEPGNYTALREALYDCLEQRERLGANAREHIRENFQWKDRVGDYIPFYLRALGSARGDVPKISIIVTAYNLAKYLPACLDSIRKQNFKDYEVIIVDDASPDACGVIADQYARQDARFKVIHNPTNKYLAEARNVGIRASFGEYILSLDADDELGEHTLGILAGELDRDRDIDIVTGSFELIEPDGKRWVSDWPPEDPTYDRQIRHRNQIPYNSMYRRWVWERTGGYRRRWKSAEDAEFWTRAMSYGAVPAKVTNMPTLVYNNRPNSMSHTIREPDWTAWFPWSRFPEFTPFAASGTIPNGKPARPIPDYDPVKLSVVIPCGPGHEAYLQDSIDSIVAQTFQRWELIVVNDTGKKWFDEYGRITNPYISGYPFAKFLDCEDGENNGPAAARNRGIRESHAPCFVLLDADDYAQPLFLELLYKTWNEYGGWIYTDWYDQDGEVKKAQDYSYEEALIKMPGPSTGIYGKADWELVGGFDEKAVWWEDWDFQLSLMGHGICGVHLNYTGFTYRYHTGTRREESYANEKEALRYIRNKHKLLYSGGCYQGAQ